MPIITMHCWYIVVNTVSTFKLQLWSVWCFVHPIIYLLFSWIKLKINISYNDHHNRPFRGKTVRRQNFLSLKEKSEVFNATSSGNRISSHMAVETSFVTRDCLTVNEYCVISLKLRGGGDRNEKCIRKLFIAGPFYRQSSLMFLGINCSHVHCVYKRSDLKLLLSFTIKVRSKNAWFSNWMNGQQKMIA